MASNLPTREEILAFIADERLGADGRAPAKIGKREIARAFGIKATDKIGLKKILREMEAEGTLERQRHGFGKPGLLEPTVLTEIFTRDRDGHLLAKPVVWSSSDGATPTIVLHIPRKPRPGSPAPGLGDRALVRVERIHGAGSREPGYNGRVVKVLPRSRTQVLGIYQPSPEGGGQVFPIDKKTAHRGAFYVRVGDEADARDGDLVAIEPLRGDRLGLPQAKVAERIGSCSSEKAVGLIAIYAHKIPNVFSAAALAEAETAQAASLAGREDWRNLPLVTIDPADAKDHDDAVHAASDLDADNPGGFVLTVAIADVAFHVRPNSALDREALERGNSVYFPDRVVPMLPERISNDLCSLRPGEDRPALAMRMRIDVHGRKIGHTLHRILMRSHAKLAYAQAQAAIDGTPDDVTLPLLDSVLKPLWTAYAALSEEKTRRKPLDLDLPERKVLLTPAGLVDRVVTPTRLDAHRLIEEFMILANVAAAELLEDKRQMLIYRVHDEPSVEKLHNLAEFLQTVGIRIAKGQVVTPAQFNGILGKVRGTEHEQIVNDVVLRSQAQAEYAAENYGHFGLHLRRYAHFTSPIRRYADLIVHRALIRACQLGDDGLPSAVDKDELETVAERISGAERRAMAAERETIDRLIAIHLADRVGATFEGRISGVTKAGLFVKLAETGADGFVPAASLGEEYYRYEEAVHTLVGSRSGSRLRLGDPISVKLVEAAPLAGALRFEWIDPARTRRERSRPGRGTRSDGARRHRA